MRRHAKASFASSISRAANGHALFGSAFAVRGVSLDADGGSAPSRRRAALLTVAAFVLLLALAPTANAEMNVSSFWGNPSAAASTVGGQFGTSESASGPQGIAVRNSTGDVYVVDTANNRVEQFTASGTFIRAWGRDVITSGKPNNNGTGFEVCDTTAVTPNVPADCKAGITTPVQGGTLNRPVGITINQTSGDVYVTDNQDLRVQQFTASGGFIRAWGAGVADGGATGTGTVTNGSATISTVVTTAKAFVVGQEITGTGIAPGTTITAVAAGSITMSQPATPAATGAGTAISAPTDPSNVGRNEKQTITLGPNTTGGTFTLTYATPNPSNTTATTAAIPWDASPEAVETALKNLSNVGTGNVSVTSANPGGGKIGGPYLVEFKGTRFADTNVNAITAPAANIANLTVSTASKSVAIVTTIEGATAPESCTVAASCKIGISSGEGGGFKANFESLPSVAPVGAPTAGNVIVPDPGNLRIDEFSPSGAFVRAFGFGVVDSGPGKGGTANEVQKITVAAASGTFTLSFGGQTTAPLPYNASSIEVQTALNGLTTIGGIGASVSVSGGPGDATGSNPYVVTFGGSRAGTDVAQITVGTTGLALALGAQLSCVGGPSTAETLKYQWLRNGAPIGGAEEPTYFVTGADAEKTLQCQTTAINSNAGSIQVSNPASIASPLPGTYPPGAPPSIEAPAQSGALEGKVSRELTCNANLPNPWGGAPTAYTYQWYRNGISFGSVTGPTAATSTKITLTAGEQTPAATFQCKVTATNAGGSVAIVSANRNTTPAPSSPNAPAASASVTSPTAITTTTNGASGFEVCTAGAGDVCQTGTSGAGMGQFDSGVTRAAVDSTGAIYALQYLSGFNSSRHRVQKFTPQGGTPALAPSAFAPEIEVASSSGGQFSTGPVALAVDPSTNHVYIVNSEFEQTQKGVEFIDELERPILEYDSSGNLLTTYLDGAETSSLNALVVKPGGERLYFTSSMDAPRVYTVTGYQAAEATIEDASNVGGHDATLSGTVKPAQVSLNTFYRFEYSPNGENWLKAPEPDFNLGNGSGGAQDPSNCPVSNPESCEVSQDISELRANAKYFVRLRVRTEYGKPVIVEGTPFVTNQDVPLVSTGTARWSSPPETDPSLLLLGEVNPSNARTTYVFQYVSDEEFEASGYQNASVVPVPPTPPVEAGHGYAFVTAKQSVSGVDPSKTYHYRLVATNPLGTAFGGDRTVAPPKASERFLEWVSAGDSYNVGTFINHGVNGAGDRASFLAEALGNPKSLPSLYGQQITERTSHGWVQRDVSPDGSFANGELFAGFSVSSDLSKVIWDRVPDKEYQQRWRGFTLTRIDGTPDPNPLLVEPFDQPLPVPGGVNMKFFGTSPDLSSAVFEEPNLNSTKSLESAVRLFPNEPRQYDFGKTGLIEAVNVGTEGRFFRLINQTTGGQQLGGSCGATLGGANSTNDGTPSKNAISEDGSVIYFKSYPTTPEDNLESTCGTVSKKYKKRIFKRINGETTLTVSESQCTRVKSVGPPLVPACQETQTGAAVADADDQFEGASLDGSKVLISTTRQLTNSDVDSTADLYLYDASPPPGQPQLIQVTAGEEVPVDHPTIGSGAKYVGTIGLSNDGSRIYFVAEGRLTPDAQANARNLYVFERDAAHPTGRLAFITQLGAGEGGTFLQNTTRVVPFYGPGEVGGGDGHILFFNSTRQILPQDQDSQSDIYRYDDDASTGKLVCVTCAGNGEFNVESSEVFASFPSGETIPRSRTVSEDGAEAVFVTAETLLPEDHNHPESSNPFCGFEGKGCDVYLWDEGQLELISGATEEDGANEAYLSADGKTVTFQTNAQLVLGDGNTARDVYASRVGGGFPDPPGPGVSCQSSEECHEAPGETPPPASPGTATFSGPGNPTAQTPKARKCPQGKVRKHGKCVKKKHPAKRHRSTGANRGSAK